MFGGYFFLSTISVLRITEEFMPIKLGRSICGRIKDIASSNSKSTDLMFRGCRSLFICICRASIHSTCVENVRKCIYSPAL